MTHEEIVAECTRLDSIRGLRVCRIMVDELTHYVGYSELVWKTITEGERYCMVKNGNIFESREAARAAINRALNK